MSRVAAARQYRAHLFDCLGAEAAEGPINGTIVVRAVSDSNASHSGGVRCRDADVGIFEYQYAAW